MRQRSGHSSYIQSILRAPQLVLPRRLIRALSSGSSMYWLAVVGVTAAAAVLRLWNLASIPPGLSFDEAANALDSLRILEAGFRPIFVGHTVYGTAREGIHLYPQAAFLWLLGHDCGYSIRLASALVGTATVPLVYLLVNEMFPSRASIGRTKWLALIAAILVGFSYWHVIRVR